MRLSPETLARVQRQVGRPCYDRAEVRRGVVHLGLGAFHRAHQAAVFEAALGSGDLRWGIVGVSLRSAGVRDRLSPQDRLYTLVVRDGSTETATIMGPLRDVIVAPEDPLGVIAALTDPEMHLVTLTVTEKGYGLNRATHRLDTDDASVAADVASLAAPRTPIGFLVAALAARRAAGTPPFTAISCDNLPENGRLLEVAVLEMARHHNPDLADWIAAEGAFPSTMVDRIVPATTERDVAAAARILGFEDQAVVKTEPFWQWVIEDRFAGERPDLARFGVEVVNDVAPFELAKLRMLNGAHSAIAYLGGLASVPFVHEFVEQPIGRALVEAFWDEMVTTLVPAAGLDPELYRRALMVRFANAALRHRTYQIAQDGALKLPQRLVQPLLERTLRGERSQALVLAISAWMRWQGGVDDAGACFIVDDPASKEIAQLLRGCISAEDRVDALLTLNAIFPPDFASQPALRDQLAASLRSLEERGAWATIAETLSNGACA